MFVECGVEVEVVDLCLGLLCHVALFLETGRCVCVCVCVCVHESMWVHDVCVRVCVIASIL